MRRVERFPETAAEPARATPAHPLGRPRVPQRAAAGASQQQVRALRLTPSCCNSVLRSCGSRQNSHREWSCADHRRANRAIAGYGPPDSVYVQYTDPCLV
jgi:hypothetical protein